MTREDIKRLLGMMTITYPNFKLTDPALAVDTWTMLLGDDDAQNIFDAFSVYAKTDTSGFAPTPGKLHMMVAKRTDPGMTDGEIISLLTFASRNATYGFEEEYKKLPPLLQKAVGSPTTIRGWGTLEQDQLTFAFNTIIKAYKDLQCQQIQEQARIGTAERKVLDVDMH